MRSEREREKNGLMAFAELSRVPRALKSHRLGSTVAAGVRASCAKGVAVQHVRKANKHTMALGNQLEYSGWSSSAPPIH